MKVISFTVISKENPFDRLMIVELRKDGVNVKVGQRRRFFSVLKAIKKNGRPQIIHLHWLSLFWYSPVLIKSLVKAVVFVFELIVVKLMGIKIVWTIHNKHRHEKEHFLLDKLVGMIVASLSNRLLVYGPTPKKEIKKFYQLQSARKIQVIAHPHYLDEYSRWLSRSEARKSLGLDSKDFVFLFFGVLRPYKGIIELLSAFQLLKGSRLKLVLAGQPLGETWSRRLEAVLKEVKNVVSHLRFIPAVEVQGYFQAADAVVLPYQEVLSSGSLFLAFSFAKPVIAPAIGVIKDYLVSNGGFPYDPRRPEALFEAMKKATKADLVKRGRYNLRWVKKFSPRFCAEQLKKIYERV